MLSAIIKRSVAVRGRKTSVTLENEFWDALQEISHARRMSIAQLIDESDLNRHHANLSSQIRTFVLSYYRSRLQALGYIAGAATTDAERGDKIRNDNLRVFAR